MAPGTPSDMPPLRPTGGGEGPAEIPKGFRGTFPKGPSLLAQICLPPGICRTIGSSPRAPLGTPQGSHGTPAPPVAQARLPASQLPMPAQPSPAPDTEKPRPAIASRGLLSLALLRFGFGNPTLVSGLHRRVKLALPANGLHCPYLRVCPYLSVRECCCLCHGVCFLLCAAGSASEWPSRASGAEKEMLPYARGVCGGPSRC